MALIATVFRNHRFPSHGFILLREQTKALKSRHIRWATNYDTAHMLPENLFNSFLWRLTWHLRQLFV